MKVIIVNHKKVHKDVLLYLRWFGIYYVELKYLDNSVQALKEIKKRKKPEIIFVKYDKNDSKLKELITKSIKEKIEVFVLIENAQQKWTLQDMKIEKLKKENILMLPTPVEIIMHIIDKTNIK
ncbi:MAG TPA: hypothetical protein PLF61_04270 [Candidatus Goldiibacteriota bacterium]|nr:hypothetical protein [Candidatus Goldiibacteriota bacterium]